MAKSNWLKKGIEGIKTSTHQKIDVPEGVWVKCPECKKPTHRDELEENNQVCPSCGYHHKIRSVAYFHYLFDQNEWTEHFASLHSGDPLKFVDTKRYTQRLRSTQEKTGLYDAIRVASGLLEEQPLVAAAMDFEFIGGSMGSVVGEKISQAIDLALEQQTPLLTISRSGGARMMEGALSLMQMAKTSAKLAQLDNAGLPYISLMTDPTTGGVTASFAMLGDVNLAEPGALIGFAGPRVIKETIGKDLPSGFQRAEFLLDHGFMDQVVDRRELRPKLSRLLRAMQGKPPRKALQPNGKPQGQ